MHYRSISIILATFAIVGVSADDAPTTGSLGNATVVENNPPNIEYVADLPDKAFDDSAFPNGGNVKGSISAIGSPNGIGVRFKVQFSNLPAEGGPFLYHIHVAPVPDDGNCTSTLGHLDPYIRGETPACEGDLPQTCQVGDLSGKHGTVNADPFYAEYTDEFASTVQGIGAYFGNRSFVLHFANKTRITCANFNQVDSNGSSVATVTETATATTAATGTATGTEAASTLAVVTASGTSPGSRASTVSPPPAFVTVNAGAGVVPRLVLALGMIFVSWTLTCLL